MEISQPHIDHLTESDIAALIDGSLCDATRVEFLAHVSSCKRCAAVYRDAALYRGLWEEDRDAFLALDRAESAGRSGVGSGASAGRMRWWGRVWTGGRFRTVLAGGAVVVIVVIVTLLSLKLPSGGDRIDPSILGPVKSAVESFGARGPFVLPGGEMGVGRTPPVYRSGSIEADEALEKSLEQLSEVYDGEDASADAGYWLAAGYLVAGQINAAETASEIGVERYPGDHRFDVVIGLASYGTGELGQATQHLRIALEHKPGDTAVMLDLAIILSERGENAEARSLLENVMDERPEHSLAERARRLLNDLK
jgi:hypothetical protein